MGKHEKKMTREEFNEAVDQVIADHLNKPDPQPQWPTTDPDD